MSSFQRSAEKLKRRGDDFWLFPRLTSTGHWMLRWADVQLAGELFSFGTESLDE